MYPYGDCYYCGGEIIEQSEVIDYRKSSELYLLPQMAVGFYQPSDIISSNSFCYLL